MTTNYRISFWDIVNLISKFQTIHNAKRMLGIPDDDTVWTWRQIAKYERAEQIKQDDADNAFAEQSLTGR